MHPHARLALPHLRVRRHQARLQRAPDDDHLHRGRRAGQLQGGPAHGLALPALVCAVGRNVDHLFGVSDYHGLRVGRLLVLPAGDGALPGRGARGPGQQLHLGPLRLPLRRDAAAGQAVAPRIRQTPRCARARVRRGRGAQLLQGRGHGHGRRALPVGEARLQRHGREHPAHLPPDGPPPAHGGGRLGAPRAGPPLLRVHPRALVARRRGRVGGHLQATGGDVAPAAPRARRPPR
mmetsp:Transcript_23155/g.77733  ORF Transcript_23155/g.77733 Transcript_23155/m.77733 type:complete len:235 (+) Transcript_23155:568-1272(+)